MDTSRYKSAIIRAARTFVQAAFGALAYGYIDGADHTLTGAVDVVEQHWNAAGGVGLLAALAAFGWRAGLDPSRIPSLNEDEALEADA